MKLDLSEGRPTGIPTIQEELRNNGAPKARFFTDEDRWAVTVEIPIHGDFVWGKVAIGEENDTINDNINTILKLNDMEMRILEHLKEDNKSSRKALAEKLDVQKEQ